MGWTPCIGPTLGAVLGLAASSDQASAQRGAVRSVAYCLGLGVRDVDGFVACLADGFDEVLAGRAETHLRS